MADKEKKEKTKGKRKTADVLREDYGVEATSEKYSEKQIESLRNEIKTKIRFDVLERDGFKCQYCGVGAKDAELNVDHIKPLADGGTNALENLITACLSCNKGKQDRRLKNKEDLNFNINDIENIDEITALVKDSNPKEIKELFISESFENNRKVLYKYFDDDPSCLKDCSICVDSCSEYLQCFGMLIKESNFKGNSIAIKSKIDPVSGNELLCDKCYVAERCPKYKVAGKCHFDFTMDTDFSDTKTALKILVNIQRNRVVRQAFFETIDGGVADKNLTSEMQFLSSLIQQIDEQSVDKNSFNISATGKEGTSVIGALLGGIFGQQKQMTAPKEQKALPEAQNTEINLISEKKDSVDLSH